MIRCSCGLTWLCDCAVRAVPRWLQPLDVRFGVEAVSVVTMQAISGAGYPGVSALDIIDNVIPFVSGEEPKLEMEPLKILGTLNPQQTRIEPASFTISAQCNRVATIDGHLECVSVRLRKEATVEDVIDALESWTSEAQTLQLPSAPTHVSPHTSHSTQLPDSSLSLSRCPLLPCPLLRLSLVASAGVCTAR